MMKWCRILITIAIISFLSPCEALINIHKAFQTKIRLSFTSESELKIFHRQTMIGAQIKVRHIDKTYQTWRVTFGPVIEKQYYLLSLISGYRLHEILSFNVKKINPLQEYIIPEITLKPKIGIWYGRITYRYYRTNEKIKKHDFKIKEIEFRKKTNFIGKGYTGFRIIIRDYPDLPHLYYADIQINSWRRYGRSIDYLRFALGYIIQFEKTKPLPNYRIYFSMRMAL